MKGLDMLVTYPYFEHNILGKILSEFFILNEQDNKTKHFGPVLIHLGFHLQTFVRWFIKSGNEKMIYPVSLKE